MQGCWLSPLQGRMSHCVSSHSSPPAPAGAGPAAQHHQSMGKPPRCPVSWPEDVPAMGLAPTLPPAPLDTAPGRQDEARESRALLAEGIHGPLSVMGPMP